MSNTKIQHRTFIVLLVMVSLAFAALLAPFFGAILWAGIFTIIFMPLHNRILARMPRWPSLASVCTVLLCFVFAIIPLAILISSLIHEGTNLYERVQSGELDFGRYMTQMEENLPRVEALLGHIGVDFSDITEWAKNTASTVSRILARNAVNIGQLSVNFLISFAIMLYLMFFLFRDGHRLMERIREAIPLSESHKQRLFRKFGEVVRATMKGNVVVALVQGGLGGLIFWILGIQGALLWGALMVILSLLPAVGAALIWAPVAIYFLATGSIWQGVVLMIFGLGPISLSDNILRPRLVGQQTQLPDYVILITTLGGLVLLGLSGFVLGPLIAALFISAWDLSTHEFSDRRPIPTPAQAPAAPAAPSVSDTKAPRRGGGTGEPGGK